MSDVFANIWGQPKVRDFFRGAASNGRIGQSYLFCGPAGSGKIQAALALSAALLCEDGGCGTCDVCRRIMRQKHPDVQVLQPQGATGYLVEQIRGVVTDVFLAPIQAKKKVYILNRVDLLGTSSANAFLKTLEEPPANVVIILLARTRDSVLATILSRCQVVPFRHIPASEAAGLVSQNAKVTVDRAQLALAACDGSVDRAAQFACSNEMMAFRASVLNALGQLRQADDWDVLGLSERIVLDSKAPLDGIKADQEAELEENADFLGSSAKRQIEARNKRILSAKGAEMLHVVTSLARTWLRDVMVTCAQQPELVVNKDVRVAIDDAAAHTDEARAAAACMAVQSCEAALNSNVSPQTSIDVLLFDVKERLYDQDRTR